jgi:hypothetical protein
LGPRPAPLRQPARRPHQSAPAVRPTREHLDPRPPALPPPSDDKSTTLRDPGVTLLGTVTAATLTIVGLAWLVAVVGRWWILAPVMAVALALTAIVLLVMVRLLDDDG